MNTMQVFDLDTDPVSLRMACDMSRACNPTLWSPISPSISALGTRAATESTAMMSTAFDRTSMSVISSACSPVSGWETSRLSMSTPSACAYFASRACSASMNAAVPPALCAFAIMCSTSVVLPDDSGPKTSTIRPRGTPPIPSARSSESEPVANDPRPSCMGCGSPSRMMEPLPNCRSI